MENGESVWGKKRNLLVRLPVFCLPISFFYFFLGKLTVSHFLIVILFLFDVFHVLRKKCFFYNYCFVIKDVYSYLGKQSDVSMKEKLFFFLSIGLQIFCYIKHCPSSSLEFSFGSFDRTQSVVFRRM